MTDAITREVCTQSTPQVETKLFTDKRAPQDARRFNWAGCDLAAIVERARLH